MDHFDGVTPEQCWKNDMLNELRENNRLLRKAKEPKEAKKTVVPVTGRGKYQRNKDQKGVS